MSETIIIALISLLGTLGGIFDGILATSKLTNYRIEQLEKKAGSEEDWLEFLRGVDGGAAGKQAGWTPPAAVSLFVKVSTEEIPEWSQPVGAHDAYSKSDKCWYLNKDDIYESDIDGNVWKPTEYG